MSASLFHFVALTIMFVAVAAAQQKATLPLWLDMSKDVETRLAALLPTLSIDALAAQTQHLWITVSMASMLKQYGTTGVGAMYVGHPSGNATCDADAACNLAARLAANRQLMATVGIPVTFVVETLHSAWVGGGAIFPMPVALGASWNTSLVMDIGEAIAGFYFTAFAANL